LSARAFLTSFAVAALVALAAACGDSSSTSGGAATRPNVVLLIADDQSIGDVGVYGDPNIATPNVDALARDGMTFDRAYAPEAMCTPSRSSMYTGLWPIRHGAHHNHQYVRDGVKSVAHYFGDLGYRVALAGKSHVGPLDSFPFEFLPGSHIGPEQVRIDGQMDDILGVVRDTAGPFFLVVADSRPHTIESEPGGWPDPVLYAPTDVVLPPYLVDTAETRYERAGYYDLITELDGLIGRILGELDATGKARDTIVVYVADHGAGFAFEKWTNYEAGLHVPMIVRWPGHVRAGTRSDAMVSLVDLLPTLLELTGAPPQPLDGESFAPLLRGESRSHRDLVYAMHTNVGIVNGGPYPIRSVRDQRWHYIRNLMPDATFSNNVTVVGQGGWQSWITRAADDPFAAARVARYQHRPAEELYDLDADPAELVDLASAPASAAVLDRLRAELDAWMAEQGDRGIPEETAR
jgi:N-sulfoglucosamine sulfohydrolase